MVDYSDISNEKLKKIARRASKANDAINRLINYREFSKKTIPAAEAAIKAGDSARNIANKNYYKGCDYYFGLSKKDPGFNSYEDVRLLLSVVEELTKNIHKLSEIAEAGK